MGSATYLVEVRLNIDIKNRLREIIQDIADRFDERELDRSHYVPHITLYGTFRTDQEDVVLARIRDVCSNYDLVPFRLSGFDHFDRDTIYADVESSRALRRLRSELSQALHPITYGEPGYDHSHWYTFHCTVARNIDGGFDEIWNHVTDAYEMDYDGYVERVSLIRNGDICKEYSVPQGRFLSADGATSPPSWKRDGRLIDRSQRPDDHEGLLESQPGFLRKWKTILDDNLADNPSDDCWNDKFRGRPPRTYVSGDLHFNHANIIDYCDRPFGSVYEMNQRLIANWNDTVGPNDTVVFLGDLEFYYGTITAHDWLHALNGEIVFIRGNHDEADGIDYRDNHVLETDTRQYYCVHRPNDVPDDWDGWIIHGHHHNNDPETYPLVDSEAKRINVAPELMEYTPIWIGELEGLIETTEDSIRKL